MSADDRHVLAPREICAAVQQATISGQLGLVPSTSDHALLALRTLVVDFLDAIDKGYPDSIKALSIEQIRLLNQLHLAVGL